MRLKRLKDGQFDSIRLRTQSIVAACGYETRSSAIAKLVTDSMETRVVIQFSEWEEALARPNNNLLFESAAFEPFTASGSDASAITPALRQAVSRLVPPAVLAFDISSMTRAWHGGIIRFLQNLQLSYELEVNFIYIPGKFQPPPRKSPPNEVVAPVDGFASLAPPDLPIAAIIGLGYERERALGLQQLLDPQKTVLLVPRSWERDPFYPRVIESNKDLIDRTSPDWIFEYPVLQPAATFQLLRSIVGGLQDNYRVVLTSLGPKIFGINCFLLATIDPRVSVWRVSAGIHGAPRDTRPDTGNIITLTTTWLPS